VVDATKQFNAMNAMEQGVLQRKQMKTNINLNKKQMRTYHITYFIHRGDVDLNEKPLLGGVTLESESIILAIGRFLNENNVQESEIKYIVEL